MGFGRVLTGKRVILHLDLDYFFAQCEEREDSSLRGKPVVVCVYSARGGDSGVVSTSNYVARKYGVRAGMPIGCMVTLRRQRMYDFYYKLVNIALPRVRDFRGLSGKALDDHGNYSLGIKEHIIFPEIDYDRIDKIKGLNVSVVTTAKTDEEGKELLRLLGMPFRN